MKKLIPMLLCLLLLLSGCSLERLMAMETHESNPVSESTTALVFGGQEETGPVWVVTDAKTIAALRRSYLWTHDHMRCCLEGTVTDYIDFIEGNALAPWDVSKHKLYLEDDVLAYNAAFRREQRAARDKAVPMQRTVVYADAPNAPRPWRRRCPAASWPSTASAQRRGLKCTSSPRKPCPQRRCPPCAACRA